MDKRWVPIGSSAILTAMATSMVRRVLYGAATVLLVAGVAYALLMDPRPCGMDDAATGCGSGARLEIVAGATLVSSLLFYIGRAIGNRQRTGRSRHPTN